MYIFNICIYINNNINKCLERKLNNLIYQDLHCLLNTAFFKIVNILKESCQNTQVTEILIKKIQQLRVTGESPRGRSPKRIKETIPDDVNSTKPYQTYQTSSYQSRGTSLSKVITKSNPKLNGK